MREYIFKYKFWLSITVLLRSLGALMQVFIALLLQQIVDKAMAKDINGFLKLVIFSVIYFLVLTVVDYLNKTTQFIYLKKTLTNLKEDIFRGILRKDYKSFNSENTAEYISNLTNDINLVESRFINPYLEMIGDVIIFVGTTVVLLYINVWVTIVAFVTGALIMIVPTLFGKPTAKRQEMVSNELSRFTTNIKDIFSGYEVVKSYNIEDIMTNEFLDSNSKAETYKFSANHIKGVADSVSLFLAIMTQTMVISVAGYFVITGTLTVGSLLAVVQLGNGIFGPIMWIMGKVTMIKGMKEVNNKLINIINESNRNKDKIHVDDFNESIELTNVSFAYNNDIKALDEVSIKFERDKKYAIVGRSGSGKSTMLKLLLGYYDDFNGEIKFDGKNTKYINNISINQQMSIIHQSVYMFDKSLRDNIMLGKEFNEYDLDIALKNSGVGEFLRILPNGLDSSVGENGNNLSGGQKQRVAIARSLIQNTPILLLDEGTSALDAKTAFEIEDTLLNIGELTVITITHKLIDTILSRYDEIIVMDEGKIVEQGTFNELMNNKNHFYDLYTIEKIEEEAV